ncbi:hypothetical protein TNCT_653421 [Trichonephila clavata]|uniref:Uncharacterized protein n=1 Tax=Trichonephila clavata TaxID=2740835 RepID=A0A8X6L6E7_TRICU|nr:hypothetical protein TNCT_653421 [Trichonephila clavata]
MARGGGKQMGCEEAQNIIILRAGRRCEKDAVQPLSIYCTDSPTDFRFSSQVSRWKNETQTFSSLQSSSGNLKEKEFFDLCFLASAYQNFTNVSFHSGGQTSPCLRMSSFVGIKLDQPEQKSLIYCMWEYSANV